MGDYNENLGDLALRAYVVLESAAEEYRPRRIRHEEGSITPLQAIRMALGAGAGYLVWRATGGMSDVQDRAVASGLAAVVTAGVATLATRRLERQ